MHKYVCEDSARGCLYRCCRRADETARDLDLDNPCFITKRQIRMEKEAGAGHDPVNAVYLLAIVAVCLAIIAASPKLYDALVR